VPLGLCLTHHVTCSSLFWLQDSTYKYFEVIMCDIAHNGIRNVWPPLLHNNWVCALAPS
jgi:ribosomal protein L15E